MNLFTIYSLATGEILRFGKCRTADLELQAHEGEGLIEGVQGDPRSQVVDQTGEAPVLTPRPPPGLDQLKATLLARLAERRWTVETGGIAFGGVQIRTDRESQAMLAGALSLASLNPMLLIKWKSADGTFIDLDAGAIQAAALATGAHIQACFAREAELTEQIASAQDESALWDVGSYVAAFWP